MFLMMCLVLIWRLRRNGDLIVRVTEGWWPLDRHEKLPETDGFCRGSPWYIMLDRDSSRFSYASWYLDGTIVDTRTILLRLLYLACQLRENTTHNFAGRFLIRQGY